MAKVADDPGSEHGAEVLHLLAPAGFGGLEAVVQLLAAGFRARPGSPEVVAGLLVNGSGDPPPLAGALAQRDVRVELLASAPRDYLGQRRSVADLLTRWRPRVVHTHGYHADVLFRDLARRAGAALVSTAHGFTGGGLKNRLFESLQRRSWRGYDRVIAVSRPLADRLRRSGIGDEVVALLPNAWAPGEPLLPRLAAREQLGLSGERPVVGWVGRLSAEKGPDIAIRAWSELPEPRPLLALVGAGPDGAALAALVRDLRLTGDVKFCGAIDAAGRLFTGFDLFLLSSRTEGTPMVVFEAMAAGVPIVATRVGGVADVVGPAEAELVAPTPGAIAAGVTTVLGDARLAASRRQMARLRLESVFALPPWLEAHATIYRAARQHADARRAG